MILRMPRAIPLLLISIAAITATGCADFDKSMASDAVDIPEDKPLSEQAPVLTGSTPLNQHPTESGTPARD